MNEQRSGYVLVISVLTILAIGVLASYLSSLAVSSIRLSELREQSPQAYFLAEAGINEAIWKIKYDPVWSDAFIKGTLASNFTRFNVLGVGGSYTVTATSTATNPAVAVITSVATVTTTAATAQRVITTEVARSTGYSALWPDVVFSGGKAGCKPGDVSGHAHITIPGDPSKYKNVTVYYNNVLYATIPFPSPYPKKDLSWKDSGQISRIEDHHVDSGKIVLSIRYDIVPSNFTVKIDGGLVATWDKKNGFSSPYSYEEPGACQKDTTGKGNIEAQNTNVIINGVAESNNDVKLSQAVKVTINNGSLGAVNNITYSGGATTTLYLSEILTNIDPRSLPVVDFYSVGTTSLKSRATIKYTAKQFEDLLKTQSDFTGIIYVTGDVSLKDKNMTIHGILAIEGRLEVDNNASHQVKVLADQNVIGAGILANGAITITGPLTVNGLLFSYRDVTLKDTTGGQTVTGGIIGWNVIFDGKSTYSITLTYDDVIVAKTLDPTITQAPIIQVNHWEEQY